MGSPSAVAEECAWLLPGNSGGAVMSAACPPRPVPSLSVCLRVELTLAGAPQAWQHLLFSLQTSVSGLAPR